MNKNSRQQLTLFVERKESIEIERIRKQFNPIQHKLIDSHVTLCREDEILAIDKVLQRLQNLTASPITIQFGQVARFSENKGVLLPAYGNNESFHQLREKILSGIIDRIPVPEPHITLMHPRNATCTDEIFEEIRSVKFPTRLQFDTVSLIEQNNGSEWQVIKKFTLNTD